MSMRPARVPLLATLAAAAALAPAAGAQSRFEGVVSFRAEQGATMEYYLRNGVSRVETDIGGQRRVTITDPAVQTTFILLPDQQAYMEMPVRQGGPGGAADDAKLTKTGKTDKVAGHACEYWRLEISNGLSADICAASDLGSFVATMGGGMRRGGGGGGIAGGTRMMWQRAVAAQHLFPLKVVTHEGGQDVVALEATKIEAKKLDASMFTPPSSYQKREMPGRPGSGE
jgi:hypothetical protein